MAKALKRPQLKNVDDLFNLNGENSTENAVRTGRLAVEDLAVSSLVPFANHPFYLYEGERLEDMIESIKTNGVLVPILVRSKPVNKSDKIDNVSENEDFYEILAGHNRVNAVKIIRMGTIPAIVLDDINDEEALAYVIETNLMQRSFADMKHSEKAAVIAMHHARMFSPGKRHDILKLLQQMENADEQTENSDNNNDNDIIDNPNISTESPTFPQLGERSAQDNPEPQEEPQPSHTDKKIADMYSLSKNTVSRYLRINQLYNTLKEMLDIGYIPFIPAVTVSFLTDIEQIMLAEYLDENVCKLDMKKADMLRDYSKQGKLDRQAIAEVMSGQAMPKPAKVPSIKVSTDVYSRYFNKGQSAKEIQSIVEEALALYFENQSG